MRRGERGLESTSLEKRLTNLLLLLECNQLGIHLLPSWELRLVPFLFPVRPSFSYSAFKVYPRKAVVPEQSPKTVGHLAVIATRLSSVHPLRIGEFIPRRRLSTSLTIRRTELSGRCSIAYTKPTLIEFCSGPCPALPSIMSQLAYVRRSIPSVNSI